MKVEAVNEKPGIIPLSEKDKKVIGQRIIYLDHLFTNAMREFGYGEFLEMYLIDLLGQMITLANTIGIDTVKIEDLKSIYEKMDKHNLPYIRMEIYELRAKLIAECVRQGVIESFKEIPIAIAEKEEVESYEQ